MKIRIKFQKTGVMRFVGHLDIMRYFQKAIRRADIDIAYSEGYSPHQIMSFAAPLGVGLTSDAEYLDIEVRTTRTSAESVEALNRVGVEGITVVSYRRLPDSVKNAMATVAAADYAVSFREGMEIAGWQEKLCALYQKPAIRIIKKTKKSEKELDLKPLIYQLSVKDETGFMRLSTGSVNNIKPELVMEALYQEIGQKLPDHALRIHRRELYAVKESSQERMFVSLEDLGEEINE